MTISKIIPGPLMAEMAKEAFDKRTDLNGKKAQASYAKGFEDGFNKCHDLIQQMMAEKKRERELVPGFSEMVNAES